MKGRPAVPNSDILKANFIKLSCVQQKNFPTELIIIVLAQIFNVLYGRLIILTESDHYLHQTSKSTDVMTL